jgi:membrane fusion protein (multidrug efflux system)
VELGDWQGDDWIVTAGLNPGDRVIVDGVMKIGPGAPVRVADPNAPQADPAAKAAADK